MQINNLIKEKLFGRYENFLRYCKEAEKNFVDELDREDFIAYRAEYSVPREQVEQLKKLLGFCENKSAEKNFAPINISNEINNSLQSYFGIKDILPYENISISELDFQGRVKWRLKFNNYKTLADILKSSKQKILSLKSFGQSSFDNLIETLKKFFYSHRKKISTKTLSQAKKDLDEFLQNAALKHDPQIDLIISAFEKFSILVQAKNYFKSIPTNLKLAEIPEGFVETLLTFDEKDLKNFPQTFQFNLNNYVKKIIFLMFKNEREMEVVYRRAKGDTLGEIGRNFGITRERVRQMVSKSIKNFKKYRNDMKKIFYFIYALSGGKFLITLDEMKNFIDDNDVEIIYFLSTKINLQSNNFHFDEGLQSFVFQNKVELDEKELIKNLPDIMEEKIFEEKIRILAREKNISEDFIKAKLEKFYRRSGKFFHRHRLTLAYKCGYILKERFPNGYKIADETFYLRFMRYLQEIFDEKTPLTQNNIDAKIGNIGFLCDRGKYIHHDFVDVPKEIIERIKNFIDNSNRTAIFYKEIFVALKNFFVGTQITNHYFLQGLIKFYDLPYILRKDYLTKSNEINMATEFDNFVAERGEVSTQEIKENFISFTDANISFLLLRCREILNIGDGKFMHASHLNLKDDDFEHIKKFLPKNCSTPVNSRVLFDLFFENFSDFMSRNEINSHEKLFGVLQYMFRNDFNFSRPYISVEAIKNISNKKVLLNLLESIEEIAIEDLIGICDENGIHYVSKNYLIESLRPNFIRVDEFNLMRPEAIGVTDKIISAVSEKILSAIKRNGGWQSAQTFQDYEWLPQLEISWNSFLLESVASLADNSVYTIKISTTAANFSPVIFLSEEFAEDDFQSFIEKILIAEHDKEPFNSEKEIFDWLKSQGLCNKKLPKFLDGGRALQILGE